MNRKYKWPVIQNKNKICLPKRFKKKRKTNWTGARGEAYSQPIDVNVTKKPFLNKEMFTSPAWELAKVKRVII